MTVQLSLFFAALSGSENGRSINSRRRNKIDRILRNCRLLELHTPNSIHIPEIVVSDERTFRISSVMRKGPFSDSGIGSVRMLVRPDRGLEGFGVGCRVGSRVSNGARCIFSNNNLRTDPAEKQK